MSLDSLSADALDSVERVPVRSLTRRILKNPLGVLSLAVLAIVVLLSLLAPWIAPHPPSLTDLSKAFLPPGGEHLLGTDSAGRDVLSRLLGGGRPTLLGALIALVVAVAVGLIAGLIAGYYGGWFETLGDLAASLVMAMPAIMVLLAVRVVVGPSLLILMVTFGLLLSPGIFRLVRSGVRQVKNELYVDAARISGLSDVRIIGRHILFVVRAPVIIQGAVVAGIAIAIQSGLEFLGLGDQGSPSWGLMLSEAFRNIFIAPMLIVWPGLAITLVIGALVVFANALRDALEDRPTVSSRIRRSTRRAAPATVVVEEDVDAASAPVLSVRGLTVAYPAGGEELATVIEDVSFDVAEGEIVGLVGESGSGKTQTAWSILGLLPRGALIRSGRILLRGQDLLAAPKRQRALLGRTIAYVPQEPMSNLDPMFTVGHQLVAPMRKHLRIGRKEAERRALALLERVGIQDPARTMRAYPFQISGGMAQRVLIAGAVSCDPELIVADEPTTALDVTVQAEILDLLRDLQRERGLAMVLVTHNFGVVADLCDRVAVMKGGRIVEDGAVESTFVSPVSSYTRSLLDATLDSTEPRSVRERREADDA